METAPRSSYRPHISTLLVVILMAAIAIFWVAFRPHYLQIAKLRQAVAEAGGELLSSTDGAFSLNFDGGSPNAGKNFATALQLACELDQPISVLFFNWYERVYCELVRICEVYSLASGAIGALLIDAGNGTR